MSQSNAAEVGVDGCSIGVEFVVKFTDGFVGRFPNDWRNGGKREEIHDFFCFGGHASSGEEIYRRGRGD